MIFFSPGVLMPLFFLFLFWGNGLVVTGLTVDTLSIYTSDWLLRHPLQGCMLYCASNSRI